MGFLLGFGLCSFLFSWVLFISRGNTDSDGVVVTLKFAHVLPTNHPVHQGIEFFADRLSTLSDGQMETVIYPSGQLGDETKCIENIQIGTLDLTKTSTSTMGNFLSLMKVFSLPYLFREEAHYWRVLEGSIGQEMLEAIAERDDGTQTGFIGLGYFDSGSRSFYADVPILKPDDFRGKKFRIMRDPVTMDTVDALGGSPTPIPWGELYTALKQGVVDGAENNPPSIVSARHSEISKYYMLTHHSRIPDIVIVSQKTWDRLSSQQKQWLKQAMADATQYQRGIWAESSQHAMDQMRAEGVTIHEVELKPFVTAVQPVIEKYAVGQLREWYDRIQEQP